MAQAHESGYFDNRRGLGEPEAVSGMPQAEVRTIRNRKRVVWASFPEEDGKP